MATLALILPATGSVDRASAQTPAAFVAVEIFAQVPLTLPAPLAAAPKANSTAAPAGLPAGSIALFEILGVVGSVDLAGLEWGVGSPPMFVYKTARTRIVGAPKKGDLVKVTATRTTAPGPLVAEDITLRQAGPVAVAPANVALSFIFNGVIGTTGPHIWNIGGVQFIVDDPTTPALKDPTLVGNATVEFVAAGSALPSPASTPAPTLLALQVFPQVSLAVPSPLAAAPKVNGIIMPAGLPAGSIALFEILGVVDSVDPAGLEWGIGSPPMFVYKTARTRIVGAPKKGDLVKVAATRTIAPGPLAAEEITLRQAGPVAPAAPKAVISFMSNGAVGTKGPHIWKVGGVDFVVDKPTMPALIDKVVAGNATVQFVVAATALPSPPVLLPAPVPVPVTQTVSIAGQTYGVKFSAFNPGGQVTATVTKPDGSQANYSANWAGLTPDQVLADAIATKDLVAQAVALAAGAILPQSIPPITPAGNETSFTDTVNKISGPIWTVGATTVLVVDSTRLEGSPVEGDTVNVLGQAQADGSILASRIRSVNPATAAKPKTAEPPKPTGTETHFTGIVNGTGNTLWLIGTTPVNVDANTKIRDNPALGLMAEVRGFQQPSGTTLATQIRNMGKGGGGASGGGRQVHFRATVEDIAPSTWVIGGFTVTINDNTKIIDNPREGNSVEVTATKEAGVTLIATEIRNIAQVAAGGGGGGGFSGSTGGGSSGSGSGGDSSGSGSGGSGSGSGGGGGGGH